MMEKQESKKPLAFQWMDAAMKSDLPAPARHVFMVIAKRYNIDGGAFPSYDCLAKDTGYSNRTVKRHVKYLVELGWIAIHKESGRVNHYTPTPVEVTNDRQSQAVCQRVTGTSDRAAHEGCHSGTLMTNSMTNSHDQVNDHDKTAVAKTATAPIPTTTSVKEKLEEDVVVTKLPLLAQYLRAAGYIPAVAKAPASPFTSNRVKKVATVKAVVVSESPLVGVVGESAITVDGIEKEIAKSTHWREGTRSLVRNEALGRMDTFLGTAAALIEEVYTDLVKW